MFDFKITINNVNELKNKLNKELVSSSSKLHIDLSHIEEIDSAGIQFLIALDKEIKKQNKSFQLIGMNPIVTELTTLLGLEGLLIEKGFIERGFNE
ncbi:MAG: STAS domain-containing protein [Pseudomonadales bacterium]|nr:STAS domain-containing protein [Pseudomonadales bacterium]